MTLKKDAPRRRPPYDWRTVVAVLRADPGEWYKLDDPHPGITSWGIRHGEPHAFAPYGSFDAVVNTHGAWLCFLGEPVEPWDYYGSLGQGPDPRRFEDLIRHDTPQRVNVAPSPSDPLAS